MINKKTSVLETYSLILIDMLAVIFSFLIARLFRFSATGVQSVDTDREYLVCVIVLIILLNLLRYSNTNSFFY